MNKKTHVNKVNDDKKEININNNEISISTTDEFFDFSFIIVN